MVSYGDDFYVRVWDTLTGKLKAEYRFKPDNPYGGRFGDDDDERMMRLSFEWRESDLGGDGRLLVVASGKDIRVVDTETGKERFKLEVDPGGVHKLALSPDSKRLVTSGPGVAPAPPKVGQMPERPKDYQVAVWDVTEAKPVVKFRVPGMGFGGLLAFTPDGKRIATAAYDQNSLSLWDATTGKAAGTIELPDRPAHLAFDGSGKRIAVAFWDSTALVYDLGAVLKPAKE